MFFLLLLLVIIALTFVYRENKYFLGRSNILEGHKIYSKIKKKVKKTLNEREKSNLFRKYKQERQRLDKENTRYHLGIFVDEIEQNLSNNFQYISLELMQKTRKVLRLLLNQLNDDGLTRIYEIITSSDKMMIEQKLASELKKYIVF